MPGFFNQVNVPTGGDPNHARKSRVPIGHSFVPHDGKQAKLRRLRIADGSTDVDYARMFVLSHALCTSEDTGLPFPDVLDTVLDTLEREQTNAIVQELTR